VKTVRPPKARRPSHKRNLLGGATVREKVYLTYPTKLLKEPILYQLGHKFRVVTNLRGANISTDVGLVALEIDGDAAEVAAAIGWLREIGVAVDPIEKNVIE
jgi:L-aspartate semialdehyde sulfurtransferase ferredoxin